MSLDILASGIPLLMILRRICDPHHRKLHLLSAGTSHPR